MKNKILLLGLSMMLIVGSIACGNDRLEGTWVYNDRSGEETTYTFDGSNLIVVGLWARHTYTTSGNNITIDGDTGIYSIDNDTLILTFDGYRQIFTRKGRGNSLEGSWVDNEHGDSLNFIFDGQTLIRASVSTYITHDNNITFTSNGRSFTGTYSINGDTLILTIGDTIVLTRNR